MGATNAAREEDGDGKNHVSNHAAASDTNHFDDVKLDDEEEKPDILVTGRSKGWVRHLVAILALSSIVLANMNRQVFNQALVSMIKPINQTSSPDRATIKLAESATTTTMSQPPETTTPAGAPTTSRPESTTTNSPDTTATTVAQPPDEPPGQSESGGAQGEDRYEWTGSQVRAYQAAFSYGYFPFMIFGGRMSEVYGAKWVVFLSGFGSALCCLLSPYLADNNFNLLIASRVFMGICQTGVSPGLYALLTRWLPPDESSVYLPMIKVGVMVGFTLGSLVCGLFPWRVTFYAVGLIGMFWSAMWILTVSSDPDQHKFVSKRELDHIRRELQRAQKGRATTAEETRKASAPWYGIMTNPVVLAFMLAKFTVKLSTDAQTTQLPLYIKNVFGVSDKFNGILNAFNFAIQSIFTGLVAWCAKEFVSRKAFGLTKTGVRRLFQGICNFGMALAYILITFNMSSLTIVCCAVVILSVASMFGAGGEAVTPVDLSTDYAASIMAIANSFSNLSGILLPPVVSLVLGEQYGSSELWNIVWWIVGGTVMAGGLVYTCRVEAEIQDFTPDQESQYKVSKWGSDDRKAGFYKKNETLMNVEMMLYDSRNKKAALNHI